MDIDMEQITEMYISKMKEKFSEALKEAREEDRQDLLEVTENFAKELEILIASTDKKEKEIAYRNIELYKAILVDYKAIESLRFTNLVLDGISIGLGIALKVALTAI